MEVQRQFDANHWPEGANIKEEDKMRKQEFLNMPTSEQEAWFIREFPNYEMKAYEDTCFGIFYDVPDDQVDDYINNPEDYETFGVLSSSLATFTASRQAEIEAGSPLTHVEKIAIKRHIADEDVLGWTGINGWSVKLGDGKVFICFYGHTVAIGQVELEYFGAFETEREAHEFLKTSEIYTFL